MPRPWLVAPLTETTEFHNHILITLYTPGKSISVVACKDAYFLEVQSQIAAQMGLFYHDIHLMLNDKTPPPLAKVSTLMGQLEEANYVLEMAMETLRVPIPLSIETLRVPIPLSIETLRVPIPLSIETLRVPIPLSIETLRVPIPLSIGTLT